MDIQFFESISRAYVTDKSYHQKLHVTWHRAIFLDNEEIRNEYVILKQINEIARQDFI